MTPTAHDPSDAHMPHVVGFEMPSLSAPNAPATPQVMVAMLNVAPSKEWVRAFTRDLATFKREHQVSDVRVTGSNITVIGSAGKLRLLTGEFNAFLHRVSRVCLQERVSWWAKDEDTIEESVKPDSFIGAPDEADVQRDIEAISKIAGVGPILEAVTRVTGMRFAAVARVSETRWTACAVYDHLEFGLEPGQDLILESTICNEIRQHGDTVAFDQASHHPVYATHRTPALYGFESYISVPIFRRDGSFFGTLCALDPEPARLDQATIDTLQMFAKTIGLELDPMPKAA